MTASAPRFNPFPGLRPFEAEEDHLFFGREKEIDDLLRRLRSTRFLSVIGTSGSGKSSLIRSGLIPALQSGAMVTAGSSWRVAIAKPGEDPIGNLAGALSAPEVLGTDPDLAATVRVMLDATLRRSSRGLVEAARLARVPDGDNLLVIIDQFEELFRFRRSRATGAGRDEAIGFVKLLLEAARQNIVPIYIVLTMRSDFIGDCMQYPGLPEAVNSGQYLVPRMERDALRMAITGPVAVGGGVITPRLVLRLLNDIGDDRDQLPVLQHALMRTWEKWIERRQQDEPLDIRDYEDVGSLRQALSRHAEETYLATGSDRAREIARRVFRALTDTVTDARGVRRPTSVAELAAVCDASERDVIEVVDVFRQPGRSFLMPPVTVALVSRSIVDLSHESLMRCWSRLITWAEEERSAAAFYQRLSQAALWHAEGTAGLWRDPELELALRWREETHPTEGWSRRYDDSFARSMSFLDLSAAERDRTNREQEHARRAQLRRARLVAAVFGVLSIAAGTLAYLAWMENARATVNLQLARESVDESLSSADVDAAHAGADVPQMIEFRRELLDKAKRFYVEFLRTNPYTPELRRDVAAAHLRLGHIARMLENPGGAAAEYQQAIDQYGSLEREHRSTGVEQPLADAYNWLGETLRPLPGRAAAAASAYDSAQAIQERLLAANPGDVANRQALARTHYNRGILRSMTAAPGDPQFRAAEADFREAIRLLEHPAGQAPDPASAQELARALNNLASLIVADDTRVGEASGYYDRAIQIHEQLLAHDPANRKYSLELAQFKDNAADLLRTRQLPVPARTQSDQALALLEGLATPAPSLGIELADAYDVRGRILDAQGSADALPAYKRSLELFERIEDDAPARHLALFHMRFGDLLLNLAARPADGPASGELRGLLTASLRRYLQLADERGAPGMPGDAQAVLDNVTRVFPALSAQDRIALMDPYRQLQQRVARK